MHRYLMLDDIKEIEFISFVIIAVGLGSGKESFYLLEIVLKFLQIK